jgi:OTU domain-containing protein 6
VKIAIYLISSLKFFFTFPAHRLLLVIYTMSSRDELLALHKKQQRDLVATITGLKKQATKKTRKNVLTKCQEMQLELDQRQQEELRQLDNPDLQCTTDTQITPEELLSQMEISDPVEEQPVATPSEPTLGKKRNRQKERLARRQAEKDKIRDEALAEAADTIDYRQIEIDSMNTLLSMNGLEIHEIKPDGHCLFASIKHQLEQRHQNLDVEEVDLNEHNLNQMLYDVEKLRKLAGDYILENRNEFIPFLFDEQTGEIRDIDNYVDELTTTAMWGSDMEILALAKVFNCPIHIYMAGASTIEINQDGNLPKLLLGYFKHSYGLGEHYNSLVDKDKLGTIT